MKNTKKESVGLKPDSLEEATSDKHDQQIATLQRNLAESRNSRLEERFWWGIVSVFLFDCFLLSHISFAGFFLLFLMELVPLVYFARRLGVDEAAIMLDKLWEAIFKKLR